MSDVAMTRALRGVLNLATRLILQARGPHVSPGTRGSIMQSSMSTTETAVTEIVTGLLPQAARAALTPDASLVGAGLRSIDMVNLLLQIEGHFNLTVPARAVNPTNFHSVESIARLVEKIRSDAAVS
jgi:acyl carrier protein